MRRQWILFGINIKTNKYVFFFRNQYEIFLGEHGKVKNEIYKNKLFSDIEKIIANIFTNKSN